MAKSSKQILNDIAQDVVDLKSSMADIKNMLADLKFANPNKLSSRDNVRGMRSASDQNVPKLQNVRVMGKVLSPAKKPLPGVRVKIYGSDNKEKGQYRTDAQGNWSINIIGSGRHVVEYTMPNGVPQNLTIIIPPGVSAFQIPG